MPKMKVFIYNAQSNGKGRIEASVFRVKRNMPIYLGTISYNCAASKGGASPKYWHSYATTGIFRRKYITCQGTNGGMRGITVKRL